MNELFITRKVNNDPSNFQKMQEKHKSFSFMCLPRMARNITDEKIVYCTTFELGIVWHGEYMQY